MGRHVVVTVIAAIGVMVLSDTSVRASDRTAFDEPLALSAYAVGYEGAYGAIGGGTRVRWEFDPDSVGIELFLDHLVVDSPGNFRHDHPAGFNLYFPIEIGGWFRLKPLLGACAVFSFIEPDDKHAPRSDDVQFGLHAGIGAEVMLSPEVSLFLDAQGIGYVGHDRYANGWTASVDDELSITGLVQANLGLQVHFAL